MLEDNFEKIAVVTFNSRGLRNRVKRRSLFRHLRIAQTNSIVVLQETHSTSDVENAWQSEWGGRIFFYHGIESGQVGVAIMIQSSFSADVNPRPAGVFSRTRPAGGGAYSAPLPNSRTNRRNEASEAAIESPEREDFNAH